MADAMATACIAVAGRTAVGESSNGRCECVIVSVVGWQCDQIGSVEKMAVGLL